MKVEKIISGGQSGADRAALDVALEFGIPHGGWCPRGRKAEDGPIASRYLLRETTSAKYRVRTKTNLTEADGTVIFSMKPTLSGGTLLTANLAERHDKPLLKLHAEMGRDVAAQALCTFLETHAIKILNVAGPRASGEPEVYDFVCDVLRRVFSEAE
jgi:hypothetical protein